MPRMVTDALFYRLFEISPETLFVIDGKSADAARELAAAYEFGAVEFKETSHRADGIFRPKESGLPLYVVEVQFYRLASVYADVLVKAFTYLKQHDPGQVFVGIVLFASRALEPREVAPYQLLFDGNVLRRFYLDEMPEVPDAPLGLSILKLIGQEEDRAPSEARQLVARARSEIGDDARRTDLIELIETVMVYKLSQLTRAEIEAMLQVSDIRETRVYREAKEEGLREGIEKGIEKGIENERQRSIARMAALNMSAEDIAKALDLDIQAVRQQISQR